MLTLSLTVLLSSALVISAWAAPAVAQQPTPPAPLPTPTELPSPTTTTPCTGEDCIPQPTTPPPAPDTWRQPSAPGTGDDDPGCGITNVSGCITTAINGMFRNLVNAALSPILDLLSHTVLTTPTLDQLPGIGELWNNSWEIVLACYGFLILVGGIIVMTHESVQTRYSIKEIGPRIPIGFLASALSLFATDKLIRLANALSQAVLGDRVNPVSLGSTLHDAVFGLVTGSLFTILIGVVLVVIGVGLVLVYIVRVAITIILIITGPLFLICHALPHTDPLARWWWKALGATLAIQVAQSLVLITAVRTFLASGVHLLGTTTTLSALGTLLTAIALFYIVFKIPFWFLSAVKVSSGRSFVGGLAKAYIAARTFGMVNAHTRGFGKATASKKKAASKRKGGKGSGGRGGRRVAANPPWLAQLRMDKRLQEHYDAERLRTPRTPPWPSPTPRFRQPNPHIPTRYPEFSSGPQPDNTGPPVSRRGRPGPAAPPRFHEPGAAIRAPTQTPAQPIRVASVPPQLRFQAPTPEPDHLSRPVTASASPPSPVFRPANPEPYVGDTRRRTPSVPPVALRTPGPAPRGGDTT